MDIQYLMKQARKLEKAMADAKETLGQVAVEGEAGGGLVKVAMNGKYEVTRLVIDPKLVDPAEKAMLEDLGIVTGGKAPWSWEAFVPIMFEVTVLFATFTAGLGMLLVLNRLPFFGHPVLQSKAIRAITEALAANPYEERARKP